MMQSVIKMSDKHTKQIPLKIVHSACDKIGGTHTHRFLELHLEQTSILLKSYTYEVSSKVTSPPNLNVLLRTVKAI